MYYQKYTWYVYDDQYSLWFHMPATNIYFICGNDAKFSIPDIDPI